jgi:hypothetical protein
MEMKCRHSIKESTALKRETGLKGRKMRIFYGKTLTKSRASWHQDIHQPKIERYQSFIYQVHTLKQTLNKKESIVPVWRARQGLRPAPGRKKALNSRQLPPEPGRPGTRARRPRG